MTEAKETAPPPAKKPTPRDPRTVPGAHVLILAPDGSPLLSGQAAARVSAVALDKALQRGGLRVVVK